MFSQAIIKKLLDFNRKVIHDAFSITTAMEENAENFLRNYHRELLFSPMQNNPVMEDWLKICKRYRNNLFEMIEVRFQEMEDFLLKATGEKQVSDGRAGSSTAPADTSAQKTNKARPANTSVPRGE
ncbi:MAG TPA: hypothetical protein P5040_00060 [Smithella sp.]|nr:hypothetical protein [Smithella sp.]HRS96545.1 hypothetical protein [Smithella sp.]